MNYQLKVHCSKDNLKLIRNFVLDTMNDLSIPEPEKDLMVLAVDEICANLIIHANKCDDNKEIEIVIKNDENGLVFDIFDNGSPFDPSTYQEPSVQEIIRKKQKGGIGLMMVRRIMDRIEFKTENSLNLCRLVKKVHAA